MYMQICLVEMYMYMLICLVDVHVDLCSMYMLIYLVDVHADQKALPHNAPVRITCGPSAPVWIIWCVHSSLASHWQMHYSLLYNNTRKIFQNIWILRLHTSNLFNCFCIISNWSIMLSHWLVHISFNRLTMNKQPTFWQYFSWLYSGIKQYMQLDWWP